MGSDGVENGFAEELADLALTLHGQSTLDDTVDRVLEFGLKALGCGYAGVILVHKRGGVETLAATNDLVGHLDKVQLETGEGPDVDAVTDRHGVVVPDVRTERRWPQWAEQVERVGIRSMVGARLHTSGSTLGSLNFYDQRPDHFDHVDLQVAHLVARHAAIAMDTINDTTNLWKAIDARKLVGQAQGILMERFDIDEEQAFAVLRRYSQDHNVKLHEVAARLVTERRLPG